MGKKTAKKTRRGGTSRTGWVGNASKKPATSGLPPSYHEKWALNRSKQKREASFKQPKKTKKNKKKIS